MSVLVIYHGNCTDGFTAAWVAARALGATELYPAEYGKEPPYELARGRQVYVVDFSYPRERLERLRATCKSLVVLDHHKTAEADLRGLDYCTFDMNRSGAVLAWDHFHREEPRPWLVDYVEDRAAIFLSGTKRSLDYGLISKMRAIP
jgi:oligoribonuclease NrnB/cAMP/cGMP phosphodiesterase (DHH superfamily)